MNLFETYLDIIKKNIIKNKNKIYIKDLEYLKSTILESPPAKFDFDFSSNVALILAKKNNVDPIKISELIKDILLKNVKDFSIIEVAGPGFLNIKLSNEVWLKTIKDILLKKEKFGSKKNNAKFNIEFVSANPTGPLHVGHCRGAILGDVLSNLLKFNGNKVTKEYYINDYGNQINIFAKSVFYRLREIKMKEAFPKNMELYPGEYIKDIASKILKTNSNINVLNFDKIKKKLISLSLKQSMILIKTDLKNLGVKHDNFFSESTLVSRKLVSKTIDKLKKNKLVNYGFLNPPKGEEAKNWTKTKKLIFKSTLFGDDTDRALTKNDNSWTYFANDLAYHADKVSRKYDKLINVLGADHTGYVKRIKAAVNALSKEKITLTCKISQLVKLYKNGQPYKMSKRSGEFISVNELINEVGKDSVRFFMLTRSNDVELDFDFDKVLEKNKENPIFYIQYCYARINSLFRTLNVDLYSKIKIDNFSPNEFEYKLLRKIIEWPQVIKIASKKLEPHRIPFYLYEIATIFHSYWSKGNEDSNLKFIKDNKMNLFLSFKIFQLLSIILENGMKIIGVSLPKKM